MAMKVLLTGASGMVGRNLLENDDISNFFVLAPSRKDLNLLDFAAVDYFLAKHKPDFIIHAAGIVGGIQANIAHPVRFLVDNLEIGRNIIMAARKNGIRKLLNLGSSCMYPRDMLNPLNEDMILKGELEPTNEGYALAKIMSSRLCEYINLEDSRFKYKTIIPCNLYGKYDKFDLNNSHMIPAVIKKIHDAKIQGINSIEIWGDGKARREFMYAGDLANFISYAIHNFERMPQNLNVGLGHDYEVNEYYKVIAKVIGYNGGFTHDLTKPVGMKQKLIDDTRLSEFGWRFKTTLEDGIESTYMFFKKSVGNE